MSTPSIPEPESSDPAGLAAVASAETAEGAEDGPGLPTGLETAADVEAEKALLTRAIGGWRGLFDSGLPSAVFVVVYLLDGSALAPALWAAVAAGAAVAVWRLVRRQSIQQVVAGFVGVAVSAFVAARTGQAQDFFLPGLLINVAYGSAFLVSILVRWPLIGVVVGFLTGEGVRWRQETSLRRAYAAASWIWVAVFGGRLLVQVPLYLAGADAVGALGIAKIVMGWPLFLAAAYFTYLVLRPALRAQREAARSAAEETTGGSPEGPGRSPEIGPEPTTSGEAGQAGETPRPA